LTTAPFSLKKKKKEKKERKKNVLAHVCIHTSMLASTANNRQPHPSSHLV